MDRRSMIARLGMRECHVPPDQEYEITLFAPQDALGVSRLTCAIYGERHPFDYVYDPAEVARLYASGSQYAVVARSEHGHVLGMIGLYRCAPWPELFELAQLMVLPNQRSKGMARELWLRAMDDLPALAGAGAVFGEAVCSHLFSQHMCQVSGMIPSGLVPKAVPGAAYAETSSPDGRTSLLLHCKPLRDAPRTTPMPEDYLEAFTTFCARAGLNRTAAPMARAELAATSRLQINRFDAAACVKIWAERSGRDLPECAAEHERIVGDEGVVQFAFDLSDPHAPAGIEALRARGYFFGGFLPFWFGSDGLLLQRRKEAATLSEIRIFDETARYILNLVERDMRRPLATGAAWG